jgi:hypothetical protein
LPDDTTTRRTTTYTRFSQDQVSANTIEENVVDWSAAWDTRYDTVIEKVMENEMKIVGGLRPVELDVLRMIVASTPEDISLGLMDSTFVERTG